MPASPVARVPVSAYSLVASIVATVLMSFIAGPASHAQSRPELPILQAGIPVDAVLPNGLRHVYSIAVAPGQRVEATLTRKKTPAYLRVFGPDGTLLQAVVAFGEPETTVSTTFFSESRKPYTIEVASVSALFPDATSEVPPLPYRLNVTAAAPRESADAQKSLESAEAWLKTAAHPLTRVTAGGPVDDLRPLNAILRDVRVVGLGEATHGSREFFQMKHRLLEYLVRDLGFTHFAMEMDQGAAEAIDRYVGGEEIDAAALLRDQGMWQWQTAEIVGMFRWMHEYNRSVPPERRVQFVGFDFQVPDRAVEVLIGFLQRVAPSRVDAARAALTTLTARPNADRRDYLEYYTLKADQKTPIVSAVNELLGFLTLNEHAFTSATSPADYDAALHAARRLAQFVDTHSRDGWEPEVAASGVATRDRYMAENISWILERAAPSAKVAVWGANGHIRRDPYRMGYYLGRTYGPGYYAFAFEFDRGGFRALDVGATPRVLKNFSVLSAYQSSLGWMMRRAGKGNAFIDFRGAPQGGPAAAWLRRPHASRMVGNGYSPMSISDYMSAPLVPGFSFDGMVFVEEVTAAEPVSSDEK